MSSRGSAPIPQERLMAARGYVTPQRAAALAGRHVVTVYGWMKAGKLPYLKVAGRRYVAVASLRTLLPGLLPAAPTAEEATP